MIGLFQGALFYPCMSWEMPNQSHLPEHGPCQVDSDGQTTVLNPFSWNNISNGMYLNIDVITAR